MASPQNPSTPIPTEADESSRDRSAESSHPASPEGSKTPKKKHNVRFTDGGESLDATNQRASFELRDESDTPPKPRPLPMPRLGPALSQRSGSSPLSRRSSNERSQDITDETVRASVRKDSSIMTLPSSDSDSSSEDSSRPFLNKGKQKMLDVTAKNIEDEGDENAPAKAFSQRSAQKRAERLSRMVGSHSAPGSRLSSPQGSRRAVLRSPPPSPPPDGQEEMPLDLDDIPLEKLRSKRTKFGIEDNSDEEEEDEDERKPPRKMRKNWFLNMAARLIGHDTEHVKANPFHARSGSPELGPGTQTPMNERDPDLYVPRPTEYRDGYLASLLKLYEREGIGSTISHLPSSLGDAARSARRSNSGRPLLAASSTAGGADTPDESLISPVSTPGISPTSSGATTPKQKRQKWYYKTPASQSTGALSDLVSSSTVLAQPGSSRQSPIIKPKPKYTSLSQHARDKLRGKRAENDEILIQVHMDGTEQRQKYLLKMCYALMLYGAPTHRLEGEADSDAVCKCTDPWQNTCQCPQEPFKLVVNSFTSLAV